MSNGALKLRRLPSGLRAKQILAHTRRTPELPASGMTRKKGKSNSRNRSRPFPFDFTQGQDDTFQNGKSG